MNSLLLFHGVQYTSIPQSLNYLQGIYKCQRGRHRGIYSELIPSRKVLSRRLWFRGWRSNAVMSPDPQKLGYIEGILKTQFLETVNDLKQQGMVTYTPSPNPNLGLDNHHMPWIFQNGFNTHFCSPSRTLIRGSRDAAMNPDSKKSRHLTVLKNLTIVS